MRNGRHRFEADLNGTGAQRLSQLEPEVRQVTSHLLARVDAHLARLGGEGKHANLVRELEGTLREIRSALNDFE